MRRILTLVTSAAAALIAAGCGSGESDNAGSGTAAPNVVVTTNILGDVVTAAFGDLVDVEVIMPPGVDPHEFAASAKQAAALQDADLLVINGAGFEAGLDGLIDTVVAGGTPSFSVADHVQLMYGADHDHEGETEAEHAEHEETGEFDPHLWTDPILIAQAVTALGPVIGQLRGVDPELAVERATAYVVLATDLNAEIDEMLSPIPAEDRVLVTNHQVFGYFADRYDFTIAGAVVPSITTNSESSAKDLEALAEVLSAQSRRVIFAETTQSTQLAEALAAQVGDDVRIVELFTESLGAPGSGADTYLGMMRTNAQLIAQALVGDS